MLHPCVTESRWGDIKRDALALEYLGHQLQRRQTSQCESQCAWTDSASSCTTSQCNLIGNTSQQAFLNCLDCAETYNATYANDLITVTEGCGFTIPTNTIAAPTPSATAVPCQSQCAWADASESCTDLECDCQIIENAGPAAFTNCLDCAESTNETYASILISVSSVCGQSTQTATIRSLTPTTVYSQTSCFVANKEACCHCYCLPNLYLVAILVAILVRANRRNCRWCCCRCYRSYCCHHFHCVVFKAEE